MKINKFRHVQKQSSVCLFIISMAILFSACSMREEQTRHALVYGISIYNTQYPEGVIEHNNLTLTDDDAEAMAALLESQGWSVRAGIADTQLHAENLDASRAAMEAGIASLAGSTGPVLFYYSGHGSRIGSESCIIPYGSVNNYSEWITVTELYQMFEDAGLANVIVILDSCHSGGFVDEYASVDAVPDVYGTYDPSGPTEPDGEMEYTWFVDALSDSIRGYLGYEAGSRYVTLSAAGAGELSWESSEYGHGIFTYYMLASATDAEADHDGDGYVSTGELYAYCALKIMESWNADTSEEYVEVDYELQFADFHPHISGTAREYALWATN